MKKKKILFVEQNIDGTIGGSHQCLLYLIQKLNRQVYEPVTMFYEHNSLVSNFEKECKTIVKNLNKYNSCKITVIRKIINCVNYIIHIFQAILTIKKNNIKLIHLNDTVINGCDIWIPASEVCGIKCITHERGYPTLNKFPKHWLSTINRYNKILAVSNVVRENLISQGVSKETVITVYDGINYGAFKLKAKKTVREVKEEFKIPEDVSVIGMVGNIRKWKGQEFLIDSLKILNERYSNFVCLIVGDISKNIEDDLIFKENLINKTKLYGLTGKVIFTGFRTDIPDLINSFDVQINASILPDPFPHVILEGMSMGKVVIATNLGGAKESIEHGVTGYVVSIDNPSELAERIEAVLTKKELRNKMSEAAMDRVKLFNLEHHINSIESVYQEVLGR